EVLRDEMKGDRSKYTILPISKFGLSQITRQRVRPEINVDTRETCPTCGGTGTIQASISVTDQIENHLEHLLLKQNEARVTIMVHPFVYAYYKEGLISRQIRWYFKYKKWINLVKDSTLGLMEYHFLDKNGEEFELHS
ncbi:MAG: ribonuclease E/G, partial [Leadbetterella sp.]|nr:ribonuclease E/G [Leadbetterella sp.]